jgi:hypothetical protein
MMNGGMGLAIKRGGVPLKKALSLLALALLLAAGCSSRSTSSDSSDDGDFIVTVLTDSLLPLEGVTIEGGIDWDAYSVKTNSAGAATLPASAEGGAAYLRLDNYFPATKTIWRNWTYTLKATPRRLRKLGAVAGEGIRFQAGLVATLEYPGNYHLYAYDSQTVSEVATAQLAAVYVRDFRVAGDTLWLVTNADGVYAYSLADPYQPQLLYHLATPGNNRHVAVKEGILVLSNWDETNSVGVYSFAADGSFQELARFGDIYVYSVDFLGDDLVLTGANGNGYDLPEIYDLSDPANPALVYRNIETEYGSGVLYGTQFIVTPESVSSAHKRLDLMNPAAPVVLGSFMSDSGLLSITSDTSAIGGYGSVYSEFASVLQGDLTSGFATQGMVLKGLPIMDNSIHCAAPPYYVINKGLWILEDR